MKNGIPIFIDELTHAYGALRLSWRSKWTGLPAVIQGSLNWLLSDGITSLRLEDTPLYGILIRAAEIVELTGARMASSGMEPPYHNRLHIADTVVSMACLLRATRRLSGLESRPLCKEESLCILTMLLHDYGHEGSINLSTKQNEQHSVFLYTPLMKSMGLSPQDLAQMNAMVLSTDPASLDELHRKFKVRPPSNGPLEIEEMTILVTEADILASALSYPGLDLTRSLSQEWSARYPEKSSVLLTSEGRLAFLRSGLHFSSNAAKALGIPLLVSSQRQQIQQQLVKST